MDANGRWSKVFGRLRTFEIFGHATVTITPQNQSRNTLVFEIIEQEQDKFRLVLRVLVKSCSKTMGQEVNVSRYDDK
jgi:hypothetical protein